MSKGKIGAVISTILVGAIVVGTISCATKIPNGYVGVQYSLNQGVKGEILHQGLNFVNPMVKVTKYSISAEQLFLCKDEKAGSEDDDSFNVTCKDGTVNVDLEMSYRFNEDKIIDVFKKYKGMSGQDIVNNVIREKIKGYTKEVTSKYTVIEAKMEKVSELNLELTKHLTDKLAEYGIDVESASISDMRVNSEIEQAITERAKANQDLEAEKQKQQKAKVEAETKVIKAKADAEATKISAEAEANANRLKQQSINETIVKYETQKKWDGKLPVATGESIPMINIPQAEKTDK